MAEEDEVHQGKKSPEVTTFYECEEDFVPESDAPSKGMWEELDMEIHKLLQNLVSKLHLENLLQEKPNDVEDKTAISIWLDKLINLVKGNKEEENISRCVDVSENDEAVAKLERFKVKNLATGSGTVNDVKK